jgi:hypothetical protein
MSRDRSKVSVGNRESFYQYPSKYDNIKNIYCLFTELHSKA